MKKIPAKRPEDTDTLVLNEEVSGPYSLSIIGTTGRSHSPFPTIFIQKHNDDPKNQIVIGLSYRGTKELLRFLLEMHLDL